MKDARTASGKGGHDFPKKNLLLLADQETEAIRDYRACRIEALKNEKTFLSERGRRIKKAKETATDTDRLVRRWLVTAAESEARAAFYEPLTGLDYDFELRYRQNQVKVSQLPELAANRRAALAELEAAKKSLSEARNQGQTVAMSTFREARKAEMDQLAAEVGALKVSCRTGQMTYRTFLIEKKKSRLAARDRIRVLGDQRPIQERKEQLRQIRYRLSQDEKRRIRRLKSDLSELNQQIPVEKARQWPLITWLTWPLPGLGQLLLGQWTRALCFFLGSLYTYLVVIPWILTRGSDPDYLYPQLFEGVFTLLLVGLALLILLTSLLDVHGTERDLIRGKRPPDAYASFVPVRRKRFPLATGTPAALVVLLTVFLPVLTAFLISLTRHHDSLAGSFSWVGLAHYGQLILGRGAAGGPFWRIAGWTVLWTLLTSVLAVLIGLSLSMVVNQSRIYGKRFFRVIYLLPLAVPAFVTILFFSALFSPGGSLAGPFASVRHSPWGTRLVLILLQAVLGSSFMFLAGDRVLRRTPTDLYEAARLDGATGVAAVRWLTLPVLLRRAIPLGLILALVNFNSFSSVYLFNGGGPLDPANPGHPAGASDLLVTYSYKLISQQQDPGTGAAIAVIVTLVLSLIAWVITRQAGRPGRGRP